MSNKAILLFLCLVLVMSWSTFGQEKLIDAGTKTLFNFGKVGQGLTASDHFTIKNLSSLLPVGFTITTSSPFTVSPSSGALVPKGQVLITIKVSSQSLGTATKTLEIHATRLSAKQDITGWVLSANIVPNQPDLVPEITNVGAQPADPHGTLVTVLFRVRNTGVAQSPDCQFSISVDSKVEYSDRLKTTINPADAKPFTKGFTTSKTGAGHEITVEVDSNGEVPELHENNNTVSQNKDFP